MNREPKADSPRIGKRNTGGAPAIDLTFQRTYDDDGNGSSFAPFRIPELAGVAFKDCTPRMVRQLRLEASADLVPGVHEFPVADGPGFRVAVAPDSRAAIAVEIGPPREGDWDAGPLVHDVDIEITPALRLVNVVETLAEVRRVVESETMGTLRELVDSPVGHLLGKIGAAALEAVGLDALLARADGDTGRLLGTWLTAQVDGFGRRLAAGNLESGEILLSRIGARPRWLADTRRWELAFTFSGHLRIGNRVMHPFNDVELPRPALPVLHASLDRLFSRSPLSGGRLLDGRMDVNSVARAFLGFVRLVEGTCRAVVEVPSVTSQAHLVDRTRLSATLGVVDDCVVETVFSARRSRDTWALDLPQIRMQPAGRDGGLNARASGRVRVDLAAPGRAWWQRITGDGRFEVLQGSTWPEVSLRFDAKHPLTDVGRGATATLHDIELSGGLDASRPRRGRARMTPFGDGLTLRTRVAMESQPVVTGDPVLVDVEVTEGTVEVRLSERDGTWEGSLRGSARLRSRIESAVQPIPELRIQDSRLLVQLAGELEFDLAARLSIEGADGESPALAPRGQASVTLGEARVLLDGRRLEIPRGSMLAASWRDGALHREGLGSVAVDVHWDLGGNDVMIHGPGGSASVLTLALRQGELTLHMSPGGRLAFTGNREGTYGAGFFNALLDPTGDPTRLLDLLESDDALSHIVSVLRMFNPELSDDLSRARRWVLEFRDHLEGHGIRRPGDAVPRERLVRLISRLLVGNESLGPRLDPLVRDITEARGLDVDRARLLVYEALPGTEADYEIGTLLRWFAAVTSPGEPVAVPTPKPVPPIHEDLRYRDVTADAPRASDLYALGDRAQIPAVRQEELAALAPELSMAQLNYLLSRCQNQLRPMILRRLRHVRDAKRAIARIDQGGGGLAYAGQSAWIAGFLGEAIGPLPGLDAPNTSWPAPCALNPLDVALLLQAGLSEGYQGLQSQINNRMLIELMKSRPPEFTRNVLIETGHQAPRVLAGLLLAFLHQDQDRMRKPLDLPAFLENRLGLPVPRLADFVAGGRRVRDSYYLELIHLAEAVFEQAGPYLARRALLREVQHPAPRAVGLRGASARLAREARDAIEAADRAAAGTRPGTSRTRAQAAAVRAYHEAFEACATFLKAQPRGFQQPWFKEFWRRNEEALKVHSVVRAWQEDQDDVRTWLSLTAPGDAPGNEAALLRTVVDVLYADAADRAWIAQDPLTRLLIDPAPGHYDLTVVSAMGVITDGAQGRELEDSYRRLHQQRGVRVVRAATGLFRSLEFNAAAIIRALDGVTTPWAWIGYSQGCANALLAESFLRGGTPEQQQILDRLVCRNLLFSAANGSAHGTSGNAKFLHAMVDGERFLKHYQSRYSQEMIDLFLRLFRMVLDSRLFVSYLGGAHSLTPARAAILHRDGQFADWVPTSTTRGVVSPNGVPEALEALYWAHRHLIGSDRSDTQVLDTDSIGYATGVVNERTAILARCDMGSAVQSAHHWSPLFHEAEQVTTERDRNLGIYLGPKDRHVFPWLDVNARFGRIAITSETGDETLGAGPKGQGSRSE